jgi:hypothetical protein
MLFQFTLQFPASPLLTLTGQYSLVIYTGPTTYTTAYMLARSSPNASAANAGPPLTRCQQTRCRRSND